LKHTTLEQVDIQHGIGIVLAVKDEMALVSQVFHGIVTLCWAS
jgi:hypothetical protein